MEAYPDEYVTHNVPFFILSGISEGEKTGGSTGLSEKSGGPTFSSNLPLVQSDVATRILKLFRKAAQSERPWNSGHIKDQNGLSSFKVESIGRTYALPPKKAQLPADFDASEPLSPDSAVMQRRILHSPISPLSPASPLYPDGVMTPAWLAKHQSRLPAIFIAFFTFSSDVSRNSLNDNQLKSEINSMRSILQTHDYKTRLVVVLISDETIQGAQDVDDRLANIRKSCNLDSRSSFFVTPPSPSAADVSSFVLSLLNTLQPIAVEYYRDLTKHSRRKKNRGSIPPPTVAPTRASLDALGWNVRYDLKLGVYAEFRQEMESALRHYQSALELLLSPEGVFETTASWSPRWNEARLLADSLAIRILRCLLWSSSTTLAAQSWTYYRDRIRELVDRRGKGSSGYTWQAWEATWAKVMAQLIERADLPAFALRAGSDNDADDAVPNIYAPVEKTIPVGERIPPWFHLHHSGYWFRAAYKHTSLRRRLAHELAEEDRKAPDITASHSSLESSRKTDAYLCPEPHLEMPLPGTSSKGFDHSTEILDYLDAAIGAFAGRSQRRTAHRLQLELSREHIRRKEYERARDISESLWQDETARDEGWWPLVEQITLTLRDCARQVSDLRNLISTSYELCSNKFSSSLSEGTDLARCLKTAKTTTQAGDAKPSVKLSAHQVAPVFDCHALFTEAESNAGDEALLQLVIHSTARASTANIRLSNICVTLQGIDSVIEIRDNILTENQSHDSSTFRSQYRRLQPEDSQGAVGGDNSFKAQTDLDFSPESTLILDLPLVFREAGEISINAISIEVETEDFKLEVAFKDRLIAGNEVYLAGPKGKLRTRSIPREAPTITRILPRPPKMEVQLLEPDRHHYTDEPVTLIFEVSNGEDEETEATLEVRLMSRTSEIPAYQWEGSTEEHASTTSIADLPGHVVGKLAAGSKSTRAITFTAPAISADLIVEAKVLYHLLSDQETPVSKVFSTTLSFASAFEANYDFTPRLHPAPWPSFFSSNTIEPLPHEDQTKTEHGDELLGISQRWRLTARLASFAEETLAIEDVDLNLLTTTGGVTCTITKDIEATAPVPIAPKELHEYTFTVDVSRASLEQRGSSSLDFSLTITWRSAATSDTVPPAVITTLAVAPISVPASEPRVLLNAHPSTVTDEAAVTHLDYCLENPSLHFLTFDLTMEASEDFAFSGAKSTSVNLLPLSRIVVRYNLLPYVSAQWVQPHLKIMDREFGRQLKVLPADGCRKAKDGGDVEVWIEGNE